MDEQEFLQLLNAFRDGQVSAEAIVEKLKNLPYEDMDFAKIDHHRNLRQGFPEVVFCEGKTPKQAAAIILRLLDDGVNVLATRASKAVYAEVQKSAGDAVYREDSRTICVVRQPIPKDDKRFILVMTAGTSDIPVAEEAAVTAEMMGNAVVRCYDVGVAGIHRLFAQKKLIDGANVIVVAAGMDGALPSVVGGLTDKPVIAVPTSIGYGANFAGLSALLSMLNSCSAGVGVVNIDNGFGAGRLAGVINQMR